MLRVRRGCSRPSPGYKSCDIENFRIFSIKSGSGLQGLGFQGTQIPTLQITMKPHTPACLDRTVVLIVPCVEFHVSGWLKSKP